TEPVEHLAWPEPAISLDRLLRHVGEHRIGAAEGDDRHLREEQADLAEGVAEAEGRDDRDDRAEPQHEPDRRYLERPSDGRPGMLGEVLAEPALPGRSRTGWAVPLADDERRRAGAGADEADHSGHQHDQRERHVAEKDR